MLHRPLLDWSKTMGRSFTLHSPELDWSETRCGIRLMVIMVSKLDNLWRIIN